MDLAAELVRFNPDPALANRIAGTVQTLLDQAQKDAAEATRLAEQITRRDSELRFAQTKIQALTSNVARHGETQWTGSCCVVTRHAGKTTDLLEQ